MAFFMNLISTHILDTALGKPAKDVPVRLEGKIPAVNGAS